MWKSLRDVIFFRWDHKCKKHSPESSVHIKASEPQRSPESAQTSNYAQGKYDFYLKQFQYSKNWVELISSIAIKFSRANTTYIWFMTIFPVEILPIWLKETNP